jgi:N-acetylneuraminate synthase
MIITPFPTCQVIAEIGCTHIRKMERAKSLIQLAKLAGADTVKFQKRNPIESVPKELWDKPHPMEHFAYGKTYLEHRINLELDIDQHAELKAYCESIGINYSSSVWDMTSTKEIISLNPKSIKIPSPCNHRYDMLDYIFTHFNGEVHISTGMTTKEERDKLIIFLIEHRYYEKNHIVIYLCTSGYPVPFEQLYLLEIQKMSDEFGFFKRPISTGFSNHGYGISADIAAYILGATYIERHFIDDRAFPHSDSAASLEPDGLRRLCRDLKAVQKALRHKPDNIDDIELEQRKKLRGS